MYQGKSEEVTAGVLTRNKWLYYASLCKLNHEVQTLTSFSLIQYDHKWVSKLSKRLKDGLLAMEHTSLNGDPERHYPGCVNISFAYVEGESLLMALKDIALSSGSACTSASLEPSYVLRALGSSDGERASVLNTG